MPPQNQPTPPPAPVTPGQPTPPVTGSQYDFIINANQKPKFPRQMLPKLPKPMLILLAVLVLLIVFIVISMVLGNAGKKEAKKYIDLMARSSEIVRVGEIAKKEIVDPNVLALSTTVGAVAYSDQGQLNLYLQGIGQKKIDKKLLSAYLNSDTDKGLVAADQNNQLDKTYLIYLRGSLDEYLTALKSAQAGADRKAKLVLTRAIANTETLLSAPQLKE